jgi:Family of unknown function (DUF5686)/CarboxypepD_reg-like domain
MSISFRSLWWLMLWWPVAAAQAQVTVRGTVRDSASQAPLPFVNIGLLDATGRLLPIGTSTDIDGRFILKINELANGQTGFQLRFSYVGYRSQVQTLAVAPQVAVQVQLAKAARQLAEVVFKAGENPAHRIVRRVVANRPRHDPERLPAFKYQTYNRLVITSDRSALVQEMNRKGQLIDSLTASLQAQARRRDSSQVAQARPKQQKNQADTAKAKLDSTDYYADLFFGNRHLFMSESATERKFLRPQKHKETIVATRTSGFKTPIFTLLATNLQPMSFYKDFLPLLDKDFVNPFSPNPFGRYEFFLEDSIASATDTSYLVSFRPQRGSTFRGLRGVATISSLGFAIRNVVAETADTAALVSLRFEQLYAQLPTGQWFPAQLNSLLHFKQLTMGKHRLVGYGRSYIHQVELGGVKPSDFDHLTVETLPSAPTRDSARWAALRPDTLGLAERNTYQFLDSVGQKFKLDRWARGLQYLMADRIPLGPVQLRLSEMFDFNNYEGWRPSLPLETSPRLLPWATLGGHLAYGVRDRATKYGGFARLDLWKRRGAYLHLGYVQDLSEPGLADWSGAAYRRASATGFRRLLGSLMDSVREFRGELGFRPTPNHLQAVLSVSRQLRQPTYAYTFTPAGRELPDSVFQLAEAAAEFTFFAKEANTQVAGRSVLVRHGFPVVKLRLAQGFDGLAGGQFAYQKIDFSAELRLRSRSLGRTHVQLLAGWVNGAVPLGRLYFVPGGQDSGTGLVYIPRAFQTAGIYEFAASRYAALFLVQHFGTLYQAGRYHRPELSLVQNLGFGTLDGAARHQGVPLNSLERGLFESGVIVNNLVRVIYSNVAYLGLGVGVFGRYGAYARPVWYDNLTARLMLSLDF